MADRTVAGVPVLPRVVVPLVDTQAVRELLDVISSGSGYSARLAAAAQLASLLEAEEGRFRDVVGDPWGGPAGQRAAHSIGQILAVIKDRETVYDGVCDSWVLSRTATLEEQAVGLRLLLACLGAWGFQYPLTEDRCMEQLLEWAAGEGDALPPTPSDPAPASDEDLLREARSVYATSLLAIAMSNEDYAGTASSSPLLAKVARYLRAALLDPPSSSTSTALPASSTAPTATTTTAPSSTTATATTAPAATSNVPALLHPLPALRRLRLQGCAGLLACLGEYLDALGPLLAERGPEALMELMRRGAGWSPWSYGSTAGGTASTEQQRVADHRLLWDALGACVSLTAHRRFAEQLVEAGGVGLALALPRNPHTCPGLAMLLHSLVAAPLAFERLLTEPSGAQGGPKSGAQAGPSGAQAAAAPALEAGPSAEGAGGGGGAPGAVAGAGGVSAGGPAQVVGAALALLSCGQDSARKTAVSFLSSCLHFPAALRQFQAQDGVRRLSNQLRALLTSLRAPEPPDLRMERQVGYYAVLTLRQFIATHLVLHVQALRRSLAASADRTSAAALAAAPASRAGAGRTAAAAGASAASAVQPLPAVQLPYRPVDTSAEALDSIASALETDRRLAEAFARCRWPALEHLLDAGVPSLLLELVSALPPERWFHEASVAALGAMRLLAAAPLARRAMVTALVPVGGGGGHRSGVGVLLGAATLTCSAFFQSDPEAVAEALAVIALCVTPPPSLAPLLPSAAGGAGGGGGGGSRPGPAAALHTTTPARRPDRHPDVTAAAATAAAAQSEPAAAGDDNPDASPSATPAAPTSASGPPPSMPPLDLGPSAAPPPAPSLGQALEAGYGIARAAVRHANGIRCLLQLLQPRHGLGPSALPAAALDRIRALACRALLGLAGDPGMRLILTRLQLARLLSDLVRDPMGGAAGRRAPGLTPTDPHGGGQGAGAGPGPAPGAAHGDWHSAFTAAALELIGLTTATSLGSGPLSRAHPHPPDKLTAAADATAPALHKIERAAIAAASHVSYAPLELLLLIHDHLRGSGLHAAAGALAAEAGLGRAAAALQRLLHLPPPPPAAPAALAAAPAAAAAGAAEAAGGAGEAGPGLAAAGQAGGASLLTSTPFGGGGGGGAAAAGAGGGGAGPAGASTARKGRPIAISAALRDAAAAVRSRSDLASDLARARAPGPSLTPTAPQQPPPVSQPQPHQQPQAQAEKQPAQGQERDQRPPQAKPAPQLPHLPPPQLMKELKEKLERRGRAKERADRAERAEAAEKGAKEGENGVEEVGPATQEKGVAEGKEAPAEAAGGGGGGGGGDGPRSVLKRRASAPLPPVPHPRTRGATAAAAAATAAAADVGTPGGAAGSGRAAAASANGRASGGRRRGGGGGGGGVQATPGRTPPSAPPGAAGDGPQQMVMDGLPPPPSTAAAAANGGGATAAAAGGGSDGDYLVRAFGQQQLQQLHLPRSLAHTPQLPGKSRAAAAASPFFSAAGDRPAAAAGAAAAATPAAAAAGSNPLAPSGPNPLLANLPSRKPPAAAAAAAAGLKRHSSNSTAAAVAALAAATSPTAAAAGGCGGGPAAASEPQELPAHVEAAARDLSYLMSRPPPLTKLHAIVQSYLRQQHRQAVMHCAVPTAMLPPIPLSRPYVMPQATHAMDAPSNVARRVARREGLGGHGGRGGARADRHFLYSRFRPLRTFRDDGSLALCAAFVQGWRSLIVGCHGGELCLADPLEGEVLDVQEGHGGPITGLRSYDDPGMPLLLSSSRTDVKLWSGFAERDGPGAGGGPAGADAADRVLLPRAARCTWEGVTRGRFSPDGTQVVAVSSASPRQALLYDIATSARIAVLDPPSPSLAAAAGGGGGGSGGPSPVGGGGGPLGFHARGGAAAAAADLRRAGGRGRGDAFASASACFGPSGQLLLWGNCLYDVRTRSAVHQFDQFTDVGSGAFHPGGLEVILNSEVWDLRSQRLLRSVPSLDGATLAFSGAGDVLYASRRQSDEPLSQLFHPRRARHPLHTAFRTLDAASYADIATVAVERVVLDLAVEPSDSLVAVVCADVGAEEALAASARVFEVGRRRPADDDSDLDDESSDDSSDEDEDEDEEIDFGSDLESPMPPPRRGRGGGGGVRLRAADLAAAVLGGDDDEEDEDEDGEGGLDGMDGMDEDHEGDDEDDDGGGNTEDEEVGMAMLEDAYAALEDEFQGDGEEEEGEESEEEDGEGEDDSSSGNADNSDNASSVEMGGEGGEGGEEEGGPGEEEEELRAYMAGLGADGTEGDADGEEGEDEDEEDSSDEE
ncbi:hypothetical protein HYH03_001148 [Edaphochlamys debaryana]|uniref:LisH domain-containing protein n=1 Tax=Edaphochlamys debaryana TaxID=47281 RepID=A0A836C6P2_9CHLO|nr:hypothetical protein HYH03_001148 [Edaphochlamys debaryana]|eukprot:KAG2501358.1 hypothetical protein HYH03_001148 [Edaphochlamys debaryana]